MADSQSTSDAKVYIVYTHKPEEGVEHEDFHLKTLASVIGSEDAAKEAILWFGVDPSAMSTASFCISSFISALLMMTFLDTVIEDVGRDAYFRSSAAGGLATRAPPSFLLESSLIFVFVGDWDL
nr:subtilisin-like protease SBT3.17 [Ipomoea batatas]